jgi:hypothetical protein
LFDFFQFNPLNLVDELMVVVALVVNEMVVVVALVVN